MTVMLVSLILILANRLAKAAKTAMVLSWLALYLCSTPFVAVPLTASLEFAYPPFDRKTKDIEFIAVLGCQSSPSPHLPPSSVLAPCSQIRLQEGLLLLQHYPDATLILTGGGAAAKKDGSGNAMAEYALNLGLNSDKIVTAEHAKNTEQEIAAISKLVGDSRFALVTSATHMPRAMHLAQSKQLSASPAPTDFLVRHTIESIHVRYFIPEVKNLHKVNNTVHEYYGIWWLWLKQWWQS